MVFVAKCVSANGKVRIQRIIAENFESAQDMAQYELYEDEEIIAIYPDIKNSKRAAIGLMKELGKERF